MNFGYFFSLLGLCLVELELIYRQIISPCSSTITIWCVGKLPSGSGHRRPGLGPHHSTLVGLSLHEVTSAVSRRREKSPSIEPKRTLQLSLNSLCGNTFIAVHSHFYCCHSPGLNMIGSVRVPSPMGKGTFGANGYTSTPLSPMGNVYLYSWVQVPLNKQVSQVITTIDGT